MLSRILKEIGSALLAIPGLALGMLLIAVFFEVIVDESGSWWEWILGLGLFLAVTCVALFLIGLAVTLSARRMVEGWLGMFSGRVPPAYAHRRDAAIAGLSGLAVAAIAIPLGLRLFRAGLAAGVTNWSITGLFLAAGGGLFGLLPAIPGLFFLRNAARRRPPEKKPEGEHIEIFLTLAFLGISLGLAVSFTFDERRPRLTAADHEAATRAASKQPAPGQAWQVGCVLRRGGYGCAKDYVRMPLEAKAGQRLRVEYVSRNCYAQVTRAGGGHQLGWPPRRIRGADGRWRENGAFREFAVEADTSYIISFAPYRRPSCTYLVRAFPVAPGPPGRSAAPGARGPRRPPAPPRRTP